MKLRFRQNSVRLRVNKREVQTLAAGTPLEERIQFPGDARLAYVLGSITGPTPQVSFEEGTLRVAAPRDRVVDWANSDSIGMYFDLPANGTSLRLAIEKDLECIEGPEEERDPDAFPRADGKKC